MTDRTHTTFMTGATGFLGNFVLRDLLRKGRRVVAMLREPFEKNCRRLHHNLEQIGADLNAYVDSNQLHLVPGSLPDHLPEATEFFPDDILSCAASLQLLSNGGAEPFRTNVQGTVKLLEWARRHGIRHIHAVSTAYVCGSNTECVREVFHKPQPEFHTQYELSKWLAEQHLSAWGAEDGNTLTVYRPAFLVGDSETGYTTQFGGFYQFARVVNLLKQEHGNGSNGASTHVRLRIPGRSEDPQNLVPIDFSSRILVEVMMDARLHGRIYHLTDPAPITNGQIKLYLEDYFKICGGYFVEHGEEIRECTSSESLMWEQSRAITPRIAHNPRFEQANTGEVMREACIPFPAMTRERFFTLLDFAIANRWGRGVNGKARR